MQSSHHIAVLIETAEASYAAWKAGLVSPELKPVVLRTAILAADCVAQHNWQSQGERMGALGAAMVRGLFGDAASSEASELSAMVRLHMSDPSDPDPRALTA